MLSFKYLKEYRLDTTTDETGKIKTTSVYTGPFYEWITEDRIRKQIAGIGLLLNIIAWFLYIGSMWNYSLMSRTIYIAVPYACTAISLFFLLIGLIGLACVKTPMKREDKDKSLERVRGAGVVGGILQILTLIGEGYMLVRFSTLFTTWDYIVILSSILLTAYHFFIMILCNKIEVREVVNPKTAIWANKN